MSASIIAFMIGFGVFWGLRPPVPMWWPIADRWWLPGGWATASSLIASALIALGLLIYSIKKFRHDGQETSDDLSR